ncbi:MAG: hypothetical protein KIT84_09500 [Labilithrix sp.]|nr:hypothetical protein [Labilithrix sp.]MCW5811235.1 hypothetical protein [Labilithrix sp.]
MRTTNVSDEELLSLLQNVLGDERRCVARMLAYLAEVEERRLDLRMACSSLHDFCIRKLGLSDDQACRRIVVARLGRRFPQLLDAIAEGRMHLSNVHQLRGCFTAQNVDELIAFASGKTRAQIDHLIATLAPKPDVPDSIALVPAQTSLQSASDATRAPNVACSSPSTPIGAQLTPLSPARFKVMLTVSAEQHAKLERARGLLRPVNPNGDLAVVIERGLDALLEDLEKQKLGKVARPRASKGTADPADVTRETLREVHERDGGQCTYVSDDGERCPAHEWLELDHRRPRALGGRGDAENVRLMCRLHNRLLAEETFGRAHIEDKIHPHQRGYAAPENAASQAQSITACPAEQAAQEQTQTQTEAQTQTQAGALTQMQAGALTQMQAGAQVRDPRSQDGAVDEPRAPRQIVHAALVGLGFRARDVDRALAALPFAVWSQPIESVLRDALRVLA